MNDDDTNVHLRVYNAFAVLTSLGPIVIRYGRQINLKHSKWTYCYIMQINWLPAWLNNGHRKCRLITLLRYQEMKDFLVNFSMGLNVSMPVNHNHTFILVIGEQSCNHLCLSELKKMIAMNQNRVCISWWFAINCLEQFFCYFQIDQNHCCSAWQYCI